MPYEIIKHLWLGNHKDSEHISLNTKCIVNCTKDIPFFAEEVTKIRIAVDDIEDDNLLMFQEWRDTDTFEVIINHIMQEHDVLVHCQMGRQRSAATIAAFLIKYLNFTKEQAIEYIKNKKRDAFFPSVNFNQALSIYEAYLKR